MRGRTLAVGAVLATLALGACVPAGVPPSTTRTVAVDGTADGGAEILFGCGNFIIEGRGTYSATGLGQGTYEYRYCVLALRAVGELTLRTEKGAELEASLDVHFEDPLLWTIERGTGRFAGATGSFTTTFSDFDHTDCTPDGMCWSWQQHGTITGTITTPAKK